MAFSEYIPTNWVNGAAPAINAANLNHIEQGIKNTADAVIANEQDITRIDQDLQDLIQNPYELPGATPTELGGLRVEVVNNGDGTYTAKMWTSNP